MRFLCQLFWITDVATNANVDLAIALTVYFTPFWHSHTECEKFLQGIALTGVQVFCGQGFSVCSVGGHDGISHVNTYMILMDFGAFGLVPPYLTGRADLRQVLAAAEQLMREMSPEAIADLCDAWETALIWQGIQDKPVDEAWYVRALLVTCLQGLSGARAPKYQELPGLE